MAVDHFGIAEVSPVFATQQAEGEVGAAGHGCKDKRGCGGDCPKWKCHDGLVVPVLSQKGAGAETTKLSCEGIKTVRGRFGKGKGKPNPLAGFGGVGCGVFLAGKAPTATGAAVYRALVQSANSKRNPCPGKCGWRVSNVRLCWVVQAEQKKEDRPCGGVGLLLRRKEIRVVLLSM